MDKFRCDLCKEEITLSDDEEEEMLSEGDDIYCVGNIHPHNHYKNLNEARRIAVDEEIKDAIVEKSRH